MRHVAMSRQDDVVIVSGGNLIEQLDPIIDRSRKGHVGHAVFRERAGREERAIVGK